MLIIQYNPNWITKLKIPVKKYPKKGKFFCGKIKKAKNSIVFRSVCYSKNGLFKPKNSFYSGGGEN